MKMTVKAMLAALLLVAIAGCEPAAGLKKSPPTWTTQSGFPEMVYPGVTPREVTGALQSVLMLKGYDLVTGDDYKAQNDYKAQFRAKKSVSMGIVWAPEFVYLSTPGQVRVVAKPKIESLGTPVDAEPGSEITHFCNSLLIEIAPMLKK